MGYLHSSNPVNAKRVATVSSAYDSAESIYHQLCQVAEIVPLKSPVAVESFSDANTLVSAKVESRLTAGLQVFTELLMEHAEACQRIDRTLLDGFIAKIDEKISLQLDAVLHESQFQAMESSWRGLHALVEKIDFTANIKLELLDVDKHELQEDFEEVTEISQSSLYKQIYLQEYDTPGGEPIAAVISDYVFDSSASDINLLEKIAKVSAAAHCPFFASVSAPFFNKSNMDEVVRIYDLENYMENAHFARWRDFRAQENARYIGLALPQFLLRLPYGTDNPVKAFHYNEKVAGATAQAYLWGNATFALAANMAESFKQYGWTVNIRGSESGGRVEKLPLHHYDVGKGLQTKIPVEVLIPETRELDFANAGFIPLSYYKNSTFACFFSANSAQAPRKFSTHEATANSRINTRIPYIMLTSRLAHYLKVLQREAIGSTKNRKQLETELNGWLESLVTKMDDPSPQLMSERPLRDARVDVTEIADNPGYYRVNLQVVPHFQVEGVDVTLSLVGELPGESF